MSAKMINLFETAGSSPPKVRLTKEQRAVAQRLKALPGRYRVKVDAEGWPYIAGRCGRIEFDGIAWTVYTDRRRLFAKILEVPGVCKHQTGDTEARMVIHPESVAQVASVIAARKRRDPATGRSAAAMALIRSTNEPQEPRGGQE